jgi:hypothetical protein
MSDCDEFYRKRDTRSEEYLGQPIGHLGRVHVAIDATAAASAAGQLALLALANQLARTSRRITFDLPDPNAVVLALTPFPGTALGDVLLATVRAIDPCGEFTIGAPLQEPCVSIGLGSEVGPGLDWYLGADHAVAHLSRLPVAFTTMPGTLRGAALASCLGAAAVLRQQIDLPVAPRVVSAWNYLEGAAAARGPESLDVLDVGSTLMVGAGAVGAALGYWLYAFGVKGDEWAIIDEDVVKLHNTNRGLPFTPEHAAWPCGEEQGKATIVASLIRGSTAYERWYHDCPELRDRKFDVVLALANDHGVRLQLTHKQAPITLQATTGEDWLSQLHRHVLGRDGCVWCRTGTVVAPRYGCSTAEIERPDGSKTDAALPFLSAASGLMLAVALQRLAADNLAEGAANCWSWDFGSDQKMASRPSVRACQEGCGLVPNRRLRARLTSGSRWAGLVG